MNLGTILKMLGVKIPPAALAQLEAFIPQVPAKAQELILAFNAGLKNFDERLAAIEREQRWQHIALLNLLHKAGVEEPMLAPPISDIPMRSLVNGPGKSGD